MAKKKGNTEVTMRLHRAHGKRITKLEADVKALRAALKRRPASA